jgi:DMSO/TMAO reductase YedYZ molybdopterin-dependent catalytic subunit
MQPVTVTRVQRFRFGFLAALLAGILASLLMLLLSITINGISLPEVFGSFFTQILPPTAFDYLHLKIGGDAKYYLFYGILVGQCLIFALGGGLWALYQPMMRAARPGKAADSLHAQVFLHWSDGIYLALVLLLLTGLVFLPLTGAGIFGAYLTTGIVNNLLSLAIVGLIFGLLFVYFQNGLALRLLQPAHAATLDKDEAAKAEGDEAQASGDTIESNTHQYAESSVVDSEKSSIEKVVKYRVERAGDEGKEATAIQHVREAAISRRSLLGTGILAVGLSTLGFVVFRFITAGVSSGTASQSNLLQQYKAKITPPPVPNYGAVQQVPGLSTEVTSNNQFYQVSKNLFSDPVVNGKTWNLTVTGAVAQPYTLSYAQLSSMPMRKQYESLECISNTVGGPYMSNALWEGVPLADLLQKAGGAETGASKVVLYAADDYSDSIHLSKALEPTTVVALRMNNVTLPQDHGYPARLLVPGIYGMKHVKWITRIEVVKQDYQGYWQTRGWSDAAPVRLTSRIDTPVSGATLAAGRQTYIAGVAFSGDKGISEVDVSLDGGQTWQRATLKQPLSALTWVLWELPWKPMAGSYTITVRAIDMQGNVQDPQIADPLPDGASGYHSITISAS